MWAVAGCRRGWVAGLWSMGSIEQDDPEKVTYELGLKE